MRRRHSRRRHSLCVTGAVLVALLACVAPGSTAPPAAAKQQTFSVTVRVYCFSLHEGYCSRVSVSGGGTYPAGSTVTVTANFHPIYAVFGGWAENGSIVSKDWKYTFKLTGDRNLVGRFTAGDF